MSFAWPHLLWLLLLPAAWLAWELTRRRRAVAQARPKILRAEAGPRSLEFAATGTQRSTRSRPRAWLAAGLALSVLALARPQFGRIEEPVFDQAREILLAIDLSRSMLAPDVKPSRLARAKLLIESLLEKLAGERVGLVVFSGTSFLQSPLSADYEILREFLPALGPEFLPEGGSNYGALLDASLQAFGAAGAADRFLIVLSDGEATDEDWKSKIDELRKKGIRVLGLGVGTAGGAMIPDGTGQFVKDERGAVVMSKLESGTLQELAKATGGTYRDASTWVDLAALVGETIEAGRKGKFVETNTVRLVERFQWPLALGLWCLLVSFYVEFPVRPRARAVALSAKEDTGLGKPETGKIAATVALLVFLSAIRFPVSGFAAEAAPPAPSATLAKVIGRLLGAEKRSARDWADLGRETVVWGGRLQTEQQTVPEGPVRDALAATRLGEKLDPKATDWPKLREELEALLKKPDDEEKKDDDKKDQQDNPDQQQQPQDKDQQKQDQKSEQQKKQDQKNQKQPSSQEKKDQPDPSDQPDQPNTPPDQPKDPGDSAFGDMNKKDQPPPPPPPPPGTQKVGGTPDRKEDVRNPAEPTLAQPLQKLEQLRAQDSPAQLFRLMEGERKKGPEKSGKNW
jgi:Ca-activated chloride channel family protein